MFNRYTEQARQVLSQARVEASASGSVLIEVEHLLLSLLKEDKILLRLLQGDAFEAVRSGILQNLPRGDRPISTPVDTRFSTGSKRVLAYSAEEAERLGHMLIDSFHLTLGVLRIERCAAGDLLRKHGIESVMLRSIAGGQKKVPSPAPARSDPAAELEELVAKTRKHLKRYADVYGEQPLLKKPWTRKQALGHLVDWAAAHHVWLARALTEPRLVSSGYPADDWVSAQKYENYVWQEIVDLWSALNLLLIHVLAKIPEDKRDLECRIGGEGPIPLSKLIEQYVEHCEGVVASILA